MSGIATRHLITNTSNFAPRVDQQVHSPNISIGAGCSTSPPEVEGRSASMLRTNQTRLLFPTLRNSLVSRSSV